jgi:hypothetical protein
MLVSDFYKIPSAAALAVIAAILAASMLASTFRRVNGKAVP